MCNYVTIIVPSVKDKNYCKKTSELEIFFHELRGGVTACPEPVEETRANGVELKLFF
jgi:hypothetical protein